MLVEGYPDNVETDEAAFAVLRAATELELGAIQQRLDVINGQFVPIMNQLQLQNAIMYHLYHGA